MGSFFHRGDFKSSRKTGAFAPIMPLTPADMPKAPAGSMEFYDLVEAVRRLRGELERTLQN